MNSFSEMQGTPKEGGVCGCCDFCGQIFLRSGSIPGLVETLCFECFGLITEGEVHDS